VLIFATPTDMSFPYKHVLLIGATSGIGRGLADRLLEAGVKVTIVGRRQDRLDEFVEQHGSTNADGFKFDITSLGEIPEFTARYGFSFHVQT
jgi:NADP-dependent 3-hydroxy acid dehydrogenase YdfG